MRLGLAGVRLHSCFFCVHRYAFVPRFRHRSLISCLFVAPMLYRLFLYVLELIESHASKVCTDTMKCPPWLRNQRTRHS